MVEDNDKNQLALREEAFVKPLVGIYLERTSEGDSTTALSPAEETSNNVIAAYAAILIGCLIRGHECVADTVRSVLPGNAFDDMIHHLKEFMLYQRTAGVNNSLDLTGVADIIHVLQSCSQQAPQAV
eukprot:m.349633 g.349633  ORF g.349633 m.349633 type:complete len:127 (+) comp19884_c5_seq15:1614-1994(+)